MPLLCRLRHSNQVLARLVTDLEAVGSKPRLLCELHCERVLRIAVLAKNHIDLPDEAVYLLKDACALGRWSLVADQIIKCAETQGHGGLDVAVRWHATKWQHPRRLRCFLCLRRRRRSRRCCSKHLNALLPRWRDRVVGPPSLGTESLLCEGLLRLHVILCDEARRYILHGWPLFPGWSRAWAVGGIPIVACLVPPKIVPAAESAIPIRRRGRTPVLEPLLLLHPFSL
mmetsp:Transcript_43866/g.121932  ORF Transcript_43866/g.121932 Transcript_43866/m.121932 type:complete len:228 (-) Transcript_43866:878-1561(-)